MNKPVPKRITYAQAKLLKLIEERKLKKWCMDNSLTHTSIYRLAVGDTLPTYRIISSMSHLIAPIEWLFYTDKKLPYTAQVVPQWDYKKKSKFIKEHRFDYKVIGKKYGLEELSAYNLFIAYRAYPTIQFMREVCKDFNPIEFFTDSKIEVTKTFIPDRGDIINIKNSVIIVLSKKEFNKSHNSIIGCTIVSDCKDGIKLNTPLVKGIVNIADLHSYNCNFSSMNASLPSLIEKNNSTTVKEILIKIKEIFK